MADFDVLVVGAGVVGLAIGRAFAVSGAQTLIVDGEDSFGRWTSSRNSEVIHAGLYYPRGSLKATLCVRGRDMLYAYCDRMHVPHKRTGKLIFAADESQCAMLADIQAAASANGVDDLARLSGAEVARLEPHLRCAGALLSPSTGIIDSHAYMTALLGEAEAAGAVFARSTQVDRIARRDGMWETFLADDPQPALTSRIVINAAGLAAHKLMQRSAIEGICVPEVKYARGVYYAYQGRMPFSRLIYPVPVPGGLGTHLTLDLAGAARFGPNVEWVDTIDYTIDPASHDHFAKAAQTIWAGIDPERLVPDYAGIRPKLSGPGAPAADFRIDLPGDHGQDGLVNLYGIESPGLTASLAIAEYVVDSFVTG